LQHYKICLDGVPNRTRQHYVASFFNYLQHTVLSIISQKLNPTPPFLLHLRWVSLLRPAPFELPQGRNAARVEGWAVR